MNDESPVKQAVDPAAQGNTNVPVHVGGSLNKEIEPGSVSEFLKPSTPELELPAEVEEAGVRAEREPRLTESQRNVGIEPAGESVPTSPIPVVKLPMSEEAAEKARKLNKPTDSIRFLAEEIVKYYNKGKKGLLRIGG